jgi:arsenate reductase
MSAPIRIYHNPRCSKSRAACALLAEAGVEHEIIEYLKHPPSRDALATLVSMLGIRAGELVRRGEAVCKEKYTDIAADDDARWLDALAADPILIERPIVVVGKRAVVARPPERLRELL